MRVVLIVGVVHGAQGGFLGGSLGWTPKDGTASASAIKSSPIAYFRRIAPIPFLLPHSWNSLCSVGDI